MPVGIATDVPARIEWAQRISNHLFEKKILLLRSESAAGQIRLKLSKKIVCYPIE
jgi:hypothetical protein